MWCNMKHEQPIKTECEKERKPKRELCERTNVQEMKKRKEWKMLYTFGYKINIVHNAPE
jgi:hypothetical protein